MVRRARATTSSIEHNFQFSIRRQCGGKTRAGGQREDFQGSKTLPTAKDVRQPGLGAALLRLGQQRLRAAVAPSPPDLSSRPRDRLYMATNGLCRRIYPGHLHIAALLLPPRSAQNAAGSVRVSGKLVAGWA